MFSLLHRILLQSGLSEKSLESSQACMQSSNKVDIMVIYMFIFCNNIFAERFHLYNIHITIYSPVGLSDTTHVVSPIILQLIRINTSSYDIDVTSL